MRRPVRCSLLIMSRSLQTDRIELKIPVQMQAQIRAKQPLRVALSVTKRSSPVTVEISSMMRPTETMSFQPFSLMNALLHRLRHTPTCLANDDSLASLLSAAMLRLPLRVL